MEPISFALAIMTEARRLGTGKTRIANYETGPETFQKLNLNGAHFGICLLM